MIRNYFKTAWRNLLKSKFYTLINLAGLTLGLVVGILILLWVQDERSFDRFHKNAEQIYRMELFGGTGASKQIWSVTVAPMGPLAKKQLPEVTDQVRIVNNYIYSLYRYQDKVFADEAVACVDPSFFSMFDFPLIEGQSSQPFPDAHSVVITQKTARKFFGSEDPLGKVILADSSHPFTVTGVIPDFPHNTDMKFDLLMPMSFWAQKNLENKVDIDHDFNYYQYTTFLQVKPGADNKKLEPKLTRLHLSQKPEDTDAEYLLQPLSKMHLYRADGSDNGAQTVQIFTIIAFLILAIACINYVNLSTARAMLRAKEVSMRKIIGAAKGQLFLQFIVETALLFLLAAALAVGLVWLSIPQFNQITGKELVFDLADHHIWTILCSTIGATLVISSIYPAMLLSSFDPLKALKTRISISRGDALFRRVLVVIQFAASVILIIGTFVVYRQLSFIRSKDLGYDRSHVLSFWMRDMGKSYQAAKGALMQAAGVGGVTASTNNILDIGGISGDNDWDGKGANQTFIVHPLYVDKDFVSFFKIPLVAGAGFSGTDADSMHFILNETAVKEIGFKDAVGKRFRFRKINGTIIGVVKDFHFASMKQKIGPAIFCSNPSILSRMYVRTSGASAATVIRTAEALFKQYNNDYPFSYYFLDDAFDRIYKGEEREGRLFFYFAAVAIGISCLGLFALAAYMTHIRVREIGIRKVLGASVTGIISLLARDFVKLVLLGVIIASPIAWFAMDHWLDGFAYRTTISWTIFALTALITLSIAVITISFQAIRAAVANPIDSLHTE